MVGFLGVALRWQRSGGLGRRPMRRVAAACRLEAAADVCRRRRLVGIPALVRTQPALGPSHLLSSSFLPLLLNWLRVLMEWSLGLFFFSLGGRRQGRRLRDAAARRFNR